MGEQGSLSLSLSLSLSVSLHLIQLWRAEGAGALGGGLVLQVQGLASAGRDMEEQGGTRQRQRHGMGRE